MHEKGKRMGVEIPDYFLYNIISAGEDVRKRTAEEKRSRHGSIFG